MLVARLLVNEICMMRNNKASAKQQEPHDYGVVLLLQVPRTNDKKELAAEQMFASLHGLLTIPSAGGFFDKVKRERIGMEIAVRDRRIGFYVWVPTYLKSFVEEQVYAQYPTVQISEVPDYAYNNDPDRQYKTTLMTEMKMTANDVLPVKTFQSFEVDPLAAITATLAKFEDDEEAWVQVVIQPAAAQWHRKSEKYQASMHGGGGRSNATTLLTALWAPPEGGGSSPAKLADHEQLRVSGAEEKSQKLAFETSLRIIYRGNVAPQIAKLRMQSIVASYKQFNTTYLNGFEARRMTEDPAILALYRARAHNKTGFILNIEETATLYHLPHTTVETPFILWASSQTAEPPANLPVVTDAPHQDLSPIAATNFRGHNAVFGLKRSDRSRHLYIIGQTGVGKSGLLELLTISDIYSPYGFAVIDPHGDYAQHTLERIPAERANDVIYFNPADTDFPLAFNPLEVYDPKLRTHTSSELVGVLKRMFENSWGPRLEYILRYSILALLDYPSSTMLDIVRMLTEKKFRADVLKHVQDPVVRNFWEIEFASWNDKFAAEAVAPILNKVGAFTANPLVRNIIGQPKSSFNIRQIMDENKILIVNLSRGLVGEDNAALLGALLVTKIQLAAMSRADMPAEQRTPFYLYVDEFQNFATDSFATILSEARKYGLNLTVANQYTAQMTPEVKDAVFGNVGSMVAFRMGADDARSMQRYFEPAFLEYDLVHMNNRHFVISLTIEGEKVPAFSAISLNLPPVEGDQTQAIIARSRAEYGSSRSVVENFVGERYLGAGGGNKASVILSSEKSQMQQTTKLHPEHVPAAPIAPHTPQISERPSTASAPPPARPTTKAEPADNTHIEPNPNTSPVTAPKQAVQPKGTITIAKTAVAGALQLESPKRKRTRRRKRKPTATGEQGSAAQN